MPPVITVLIVGGAASVIVSIVAVATTMLSSCMSRSEEESELTEFACRPESSPDVAAKTISHRSDHWACTEER
jgi:hypothetical protein